MNNMKSKEVLARIEPTLKNKCGSYSPIAVFLSPTRSPRGNLECTFANTVHTRSRIDNNDPLLIAVFSEASHTLPEAGEILRLAEV